MTKLANLCMQCPDWIGIKLAKLASGIKLAIPVSRSVLNLHPAADPIFFWTYMLLPPILYIPQDKPARQMPLRPLAGGNRGGEYQRTTRGESQS
jgi:hypothetical protein